MVSCWSCACSACISSKLGLVPEAFACVNRSCAFACCSCRIACTWAFCVSFRSSSVASRSMLWMPCPVELGGVVGGVWANAAPAVQSMARARTLTFMESLLVRLGRHDRLAALASPDGEQSLKTVNPEPRPSLSDWRYRYCAGRKSRALWAPQEIADDFLGPRRGRAWHAGENHAFRPPSELCDDVGPLKR